MWVYCPHKLQRLDIPNLLLGVHLLLVCLLIGGKKNISNEVMKSEFLNMLVSTKVKVFLLMVPSCLRELAVRW